MFAYHIVLIGFMGTGKTTVAKQLGERCKMQVVDMDQRIARRAELSIPEIFASYGEQYFRDLETECLQELQQEQHAVISCGGGTALREENVSLMKKRGKVVLLTASPEEILSRVGGSQERPLLSGRNTVEGITELMEVRRQRYEKAADLIVHTDHKNVETVCDEILAKLKGMDEKYVG